MAHKIIAISRQFGSGGREIGMLVARRLGIKCYDKELIDMAAEHGDLEYKRLHKVDEKNESPWYTDVVYDGNHNVAKGKPASFVLFDLESAVIKNIARNEDAVIVGRCADYALEEFDNVLTVFIHAKMEARIRRIARIYNLTDAKAKEMIQKTDKQRSSYYNYYTNKKWSDAESYDICLDSSVLGIDGTAEAIKHLVAIKESDREKKL